jgi:hypothetical protein
MKLLTDQDVYAVTVQFLRGLCCNRNCQGSNALRPPELRREATRSSGCLPMPTRKWTIFAGILTLSGCGGTVETAPKPAVATPAPTQQKASVPAPKQQSAWTTHNSADGGYSILMPAKPQISSQPGKLFTVYIASCEQPDATFTVTYFDPPARALAPGLVEITMKRDRDMSMQDIEGSLRSEKKVTISKDGRDWPGLASVMVNAAEIYTSRLYAVAGRMYSLQVKRPKSKDNEADVTKFFESFKIPDSTKPEKVPDSTKPE